MSNDAFEDVFGESVNDEDQGDAGAEDKTDDVEEQETEQAEDEAGDEDSADDNDSDDADATVPKAALLGEQRRRQELRDELQKEREARARLEGQLSALEKQKEDKSEGGDAPDDDDFWSDPEGHYRKLQERMERAEAAAAGADSVALARLSRAQARREHDDFDEVMASYKDVLEANPAIGKKVAESDHPAETAYQFVKQAKALENPEDVEEAIAQKLLNDPAFLDRVKSQILKGNSGEPSTKGKPSSTKNLADVRDLGEPTNDDDMPVSEDDFDRLFAS